MAYRFTQGNSGGTARWMAAFVAGAMVTTGAADAATMVWSSTTGGDFLDPTKWSAGGDADGIPDSDDLVIFNQSTNLDGTVTFSSSAQVSGLQMRSDSGVITFDIGAGQTFTVSGGPIVGSADDSAQLRIISGTFAAGSNFIINSSNVNSVNNKVTVTGEGTVLNTANSSIRVGGRGGSGNELTVSAGGDVTDAGTVFIGLQGASNNTLTVTGAGSTLSGAGAVQIGASNTEVAAGGVNNRLEVLAGGQFTGNHMLLGVGNTFAATGNHVRVSGTGSVLTLTNADDREFGLELGSRYGDNDVLIENGASMSIGGGKVILGKESTAGTNNLLHVDNATFTHSDPTDGINARRGTIRLSDGGAITSASLTLGEEGRLEGNGSITANVAAPTEIIEEVPTLLPGGTVDVGFSTGMIDVTGDWDNTNLSILLEVDDLSLAVTPGTSHDLLNIVGQFTHGGSITIDVSELNFGTQTEVKVVGWTSDTGASGDTSVLFTGGTGFAEFRSDGLYVAVPEPATAGLVGAGLLLCRRIGARRHGKVG